MKLSGIFLVIALLSFIAYAQATISDFGFCPGWLRGCARRCENDLGERLVTSQSMKPVKQIMDELEAKVRERELIVSARIDHGAAAAAVEIPLRATEVLIFGNPRGGSLLMQAAPTIAIDLPLKIVAWQESEEVAKVGYYKQTYIREQHCLDTTESENVVTMADTLLAALVAEVI